MSRASWFIVLVEDQRQQAFVRRYLKRIDKRNQIQFDSLPAGKLAGEQWVRSRYAANVAAYRARAARAGTALVVVIDADTHEVAYRVDQLAKALEEGNIGARGAREQISHLIAKRNIETWILCLNNKRFKGHPINEQEDYKPHNKILKIDEQIKPAAEEFFNWSRPNADVPDRCVDSIRLAILEVRKIE